MKTDPTLEGRQRMRPGQWALLALVVAYIGILILAPLVSLVLSAFASGIGPLLAALTDAEVLGAFWRTILIALITVSIHMVFGTVVAWVLVRHQFAGKRLLNGLIDLPFAVSAVVAGYMLLLLFGQNGALGPLLRSLGARVAFALPGMVIATIFVTLPFVIRELMPILHAIGVEQEHAAATMGASGWQIFWQVTFPALRRGLLYGLTLTFARALGEFGAVLVIGGAIQQQGTVTLYINNALDERQYVGAYSAALVLGILSVVFVLGTNLMRSSDGH